MTVEPSAGLYCADKFSTIGNVNSNIYRKQSRSSYESRQILLFLLFHFLNKYKN